MTTQPHLFEDPCDYEPFFDPIEFADADVPSPFTTWVYCSECSGSGENPRGYGVCPGCKGSGEVPG